MIQVVYLGLDEIKPYEKNPRRNAQAVDAVAASIDNFGFKVPIVLDKHNVIVAGHTRYAAAQKLGIDKVPCVRAEHLTPKQARAFRLADNKTAELAEWDKPALNLELNELMGLFDMTEFGFSLMTTTDPGKNAENDNPDLEGGEKPEEGVIICPRCKRPFRKGAFKHDSDSV